MPPGADVVVMLEHTTETGQHVKFRKRTSPGTNIRRRAEEARRGTILLNQGTVLNPVRIGLCAAAGKAMPRVYSRPRAAIIITGEEIRRVDDSVRSHELRDSNGPALSAALNAWGYDCGATHMAPDNIKTITRLLQRVIEKHDVVFLTGGVSVGRCE